PRQPLLLALKSHPRQPFGRGGHRLPARRPAEQQRQRRVLLGGQFGDEHARLEHEPELVTSQFAATGLAEPVDPLPGQEHLTLVGGEDAREDVQQGALARARRSDDRHGLTAGEDRKSTRLNSSHVKISYAVFCLKKKKEKK